jgi:hypothetical protein
MLRPASDEESWMQKWVIASTLFSSESGKTSSVVLGRRMTLGVRPHQERLLDRCSRESRRGLRRSGRRRSVQIRGKSRELVIRQGAKEGFKHDLGFPQTGTEIIMQTIEDSQIGRWLGAVADFSSRAAKFPIQATERIAENPYFMEKARTIAEQDVVDNSVP